MAEIQEKDSGKGGKVRSKKNSGRPDMTPMVDLGFLLITFFMFTTTFSKPNMMKLNMPEKPKDEEKVILPPIKESNMLTIIMGRDDRIFYHQKVVDDLTPADLLETDYSAEGIRATIDKYRKAAIDTNIFTVIIKPEDKSTFKNAVDILDEMEVTGNKRSAIVDIDKKEQAVLEEKLKTPKVN